MSEPVYNKPEDPYIFHVWSMWCLCENLNFFPIVDILLQ